MAPISFRKWHWLGANDKTNCGILILWTQHLITRIDNLHDIYVQYLLLNCYQFILVANRATLHNFLGILYSWWRRPSTFFSGARSEFCWANTKPVYSSGFVTGDWEFYTHNWMIETNIIVTFLSADWYCHPDADDSKWTNFIGIRFT